MLQVLCMFVKIAIVSAQFCTDLSHLKDKIEIGKLSNAKGFLDIDEIGIMQCMQSCLQYSLCTSINFINNKCTLLAGESHSLDDYHGAITSMKKKWPAENIAGACFNNRCANNSKCVVNSKNQALCEVIGCSGVPNTTDYQLLNVDSFNSKPLWNINDEIGKPCVTPIPTTVVCQNNGQWSALSCNLPVDCRDAHSRHMNLSVTIDIDLDGVNGAPISVKCQHIKESDSYEVTVHHKSGELKANGHESKYSQRLNVIYEANIEALTKLVTRSKSCNQTITVICTHTKIVGHMAWINRRNTLSYYFAGNDVEYKGCSCGLTDSCIESNLKCNCDINNKTTTEDTGEITNKDDLPVLGMAVGDTGSDFETAQITIGPLICRQ